MNAELPAVEGPAEAEWLVSEAEPAAATEAAAAAWMGPSLPFFIIPSSVTDLMPRAAALAADRGPRTAGEEFGGADDLALLARWAGSIVALLACLAIRRRQRSVVAGSMGPIVIRRAERWSSKKETSSGCSGCLTNCPALCEAVRQLSPSKCATHHLF